MRRTGVAALLAAMMLTLAGCGGGAQPAVSGISTPDNGGYAGAYLGDRPYAVPSVPLTDTDGEPFDASRSGKPLTILFFGYTNCPDICQVVMSTIASAITRLDKAEKKDVQVVFVTSDPARDTTQVMRAYLSRFNPEFLGATGSIDDIDRLAKPLGIFIKKGRKLPGGGYEVDHTTSVVAVQGGHAPLIWTTGVSPAGMAADIKKLLK